MASKADLFGCLLDGSAEFEDICEAAKKGLFPIALSGVTDTVKSHIAYSLCRKLNKRLFFVTYSESNAKKIAEDCGFFFGENISYFPDRELMFYDVEAAAQDIKKDRLTIIEKLISYKNKPLIVTTFNALQSPTVSKKLYESSVITLKVGDECDLSRISEKMVALGYKSVDMIEGRGQFSIRGGIFDFYPLWSELALRIELFDTEIEGIRYFDPDNQRTVENINETKITPVTEEIITEDKRKELAAVLENLIKKSKKSEKLQEMLKRDSERIKEEISFPSMDKYIPFLSEEINSLWDYITDEYLVIFDDPKRIKETAQSNDNRFDDSITDMLEREVIPKSSFNYRKKYKNIISDAEKKAFVSFSPLSVHSFDFKPKYISAVTVKSLNNYNGKLALLYDAIRYYKENKYKILVLAGGRQRGNGLSEQLAAENIMSSFFESGDVTLENGKVIITVGSISRGFEYPLIRTVVISDKEIFGEAKKKKKPKFSSKDAVQSFSDLSVGDYVVHQNHGIGKYVGIQRLTVGGVKRDYLKILYKGEDCLYVPTDQLKMLFKYTGGSNSVHLNRLGGADWKKTKERVRASCADMANKLIALYAKRVSLKGIEYLPDTEWQRDFEASFPYDETDDQLKSVEEIKADMESGKPMDRLLCGDVGYGKTEVAMRAAFKAVMSGYQVAYLVPTTILASQHYSTFKQRMNGFAVNVAMLSRFVPAAAQKKITEDLKCGNIDIIIGTHRLLNKNIKYKRLGLLIIDEEQRFGVSHKERIKEMKNEIDVLTLSATPIPRTLHMSLSGIRDMSVLTTPPGDRYPVATYVLEYNEDVIKEAIEKETARGGQVFYLYNRVEGIEKKTEELKRLLPELKIVAAHGKMSENQLESIMLDVSEGETDVLVCTTIIETGLDIPNVNTIIIEDSERLGLSQLYQLRGRVGRSNRLAYAYLTYRKDKVLNEDAQKRLTAIKEFTEFGSGFKIALKDLEIRGTGNVVGPQQSGNMEVVGYDMYCKLLSEAVAELKGKKKQEETETLVDLPVNAFIPESYISSHRQRIELYKKISAIETKEDMLDVYDETLDRFGDVPGEVNNLMLTALVRFSAAKRRFTELKGGKNELFLYFASENPPAFEKLIEKMKTDKNIILRNTSKPHIYYKFKEFKDDYAYLNFIYDFLNFL